MNNLKDISEKSKKIIRGLELAYEKMIKFKRSKNTPLVVSKNGKVVKIDPHKAPSTTSYTLYNYSDEQEKEYNSN